MPTVKKTKFIKLRVTPEQHGAFTRLARAEGGVSAILRKRIFGGRVIGHRAGFDSALLLARIHNGILQIARNVSHPDDTLSVALVLSQLVAIERQLTELLIHTKK